MWVGRHLIVHSSNRESRYNEGCKGPRKRTAGLVSHVREGGRGRVCTDAIDCT